MNEPLHAPAAAAPEPLGARDRPRLHRARLPLGAPRRSARGPLPERVRRRVARREGAGAPPARRATCAPRTCRSRASASRPTCGSTRIRRRPSSPASLRSFARLGVRARGDRARRRAPPAAAPLAQRLAAEAAIYRSVASACRAVRACSRVTTWGVTDAASWLGASQRGLPFDAGYRAKPAWWALARPAAHSSRLTTSRTSSWIASTFSVRSHTRPPSRRYMPSPTAIGTDHHSQ